MNTKYLLVSLASLLLIPTALAQTLSPSEIFRQVSPSVVVVKVYSKQDKLLSLGSGVVIAGGVVVTNCHVLNTKNAQYAEVQYRSKDLGAELRHADIERDLCTLAVTALPASPARIGSSRNVEIGSKVYAVGAPEGYELTLSDGLVSGKRELNGNQYIQITTPISHGSSGGGLFDDKGRLVGITTLMDTSGQALNFAIPAEWITEIPHRNTFHPKTADRIDAPQPQHPATDIDANSRWHELVKNAGSVYYSDTKSLRTAGDNISVWIKEVPLYSGSWVIDGKSVPYNDQYLHITFFCDSREMSILESYITNTSGTQLASRSQLDRFSVAPTSSYDPVIEAACSR